MIEDGLQVEKLKDYQNRFEQASSGTVGSTKKTFPNLKKNERNEKDVHKFNAKIPCASLLLSKLSLSIIYIHHPFASHLP